MVNDFDWLVRQIKPLIEIGSKYDALYKGTYYTPREWAVIKLVGLQYYLPIYTRIIRKNFSGQMRYIDLLAGPGLCKIRRTGDVVAGSPLIAAHSKIKFDEYIFVEKNPERYDALENRLNLTGVNFKPLQEDCNQCIDELLADFKEGDHYLAFIDNEGMNVSGNTVSKLLEKRGDLIINFQSNGINRVRGKAVNNSADADALTHFYGDEKWKACTSASSLLDTYIARIRDSSDKKEVVHLLVPGIPQYSYDLIIATRKTTGGNPWLQPMKRLSHLFEQYGADYVKNALDRATNRTKSLEHYMKGQSITSA